MDDFVGAVHPGVDNSNFDFLVSLTLPDHRNDSSQPRGFEPVIRN